MNKSYFCFIFLVSLCIIGNSQNSVPRFCREINTNYQCLACLDEYVLDTVNNLCLEVSSGNSNQGQTGTTVEGQTGTTTTTTDTSSTSIIIIDLNCKVPGANNVCQECYSGFYYDSLLEFRCVVVNPQCASHNDRGDCLTCYNGFVIYLTTCIQEVQSVPVAPQQPNEADRDPNCKQFSPTNLTYCVRCSYRYQFNQNHICAIVSPDCQSWNTLRHCISCYPGYSLIGTQCIEQERTQPTQSPDTNDGQSYFVPYFDDNKCIQRTRIDEVTELCTKCAWRCVLIDNQCYVVSDQCKTWNSQALCTDCYDGYQLKEGSCLTKSEVAVITVQPATIDDFCIKRSEQTGECTECSYRNYLRLNGYCAQVSDLCKSWDIISGQCTECYDGYQKQNGACFIPDPNCSIQSLNKGCLQCVDRYYIFNKFCTIVSATCQTYSIENGWCLTCKEGHHIKDNKCVQN